MNEKKLLEDITTCPNDKQPLVKIEGSCIVPPTQDVMDELGFDNLPEGTRIYTLILAICPKCGYHIQTELTQEEFEARK